MSDATPPVPATWQGFIDDAATFPPGEAPLDEAVSAYTARRSEWYAAMAGPLVIRDTDVVSLSEQLPLAVVITGGAGSIEGPASMATRQGHELVALEIALRDLDDLPGNARRVNAAVDAAVAAGSLTEDTRIYVELPDPGPGDPAHGWLTAADVVAEADHRVKFRTGGLTPDAFPASAALAARIDAALDRELRFKCTAGLHRALRHTDAGQVHHGFLNVLVATSMLIDGAPRDEAVRVLESTDAQTVTTAAAGAYLDGGRRWFTSFGSCSVTEPVESLVATGLLEAP